MANMNSPDGGCIQQNVYAKFEGEILGLKTIMVKNANIIGR